jgi:hypothetical protein
MNKVLGRRLLQSFAEQIRKGPDWFQTELRPVLLPKYPLIPSVMLQIQYEQHVTISYGVHIDLSTPVYPRSRNSTRNNISFATRCTLPLNVRVHHVHKDVYLFNVYTYTHYVIYVYTRSVDCN